MRPSFILWVIFIYVCCSPINASRLSVSGNSFQFNGKRVFLSGVNFAWNSYGYDFGNGQYIQNSKSTFLSWLDEVANSGGNSVRVWLHVEGYNTPAFDSNGYVTGPDQSGTLIADLRSFLDAAKSRNIFVIPVLWNGASQSNMNVINLFWDTSKLQTYIDKALKPLVGNVTGHAALAAWEIINEPEGLLYNNLANSNPCFNTVPLANTGAGWTGKYIPINYILRFINWQAQAIHETDPGALVTVGSWSEHGQTDAYSDSRNYMSDTCLTTAGGKSQGKIDFYQMHTYSWNGQFGTHAPFKVNASAYKLTKPLLIGEFASVCAAGMTIQQLFNYVYQNGYQGAMSWQYAGGSCSDSRLTQDTGLLQLKGKNSSAGLVNFPIV